MLHCDYQAVLYDIDTVIKKPIGERIRRMRGNRPRRILAEALNISAQAVADWEDQDKPTHPEVTKIPTICDVLGVNERWLIRGTGERSSELFSLIDSLAPAQRQQAIAMLKTFKQTDSPAPETHQRPSNEPPPIAPKKRRKRSRRPAA
jgi:transcriptional regulator with XRE-family HTH domain